MEDERLYFNGLLLELLPESPVALSLQVNDIISLETRQSNFTRGIKLPKSPQNINIMAFLGVVGNSSNMPYQKNVINYFVGNDCLIRDGWGIINETNEFYNLTVIDGSIDLYKSIENKSLADLDLAEITHEKDLDTITNSWLGVTKYKYILADYNGNPTYQSSTNETVINVDYIVPSVNVAYIWNKIFSENGATYEGSFSETEDFKNLWMTYPKGVSTSSSLTPITTFHGGANTNARGGGARYLIDSLPITSPAAEILSVTSITNNGYGTTDEFVRAKENRVFNIKITGKVQGMWTDNSRTLPVDLIFVKNTQTQSSNTVANSASIPKIVLATDITIDTDLDIDYDFILEVGETFNLLEKATGDVSISHYLTNQTNFNVVLSYYDSVLVDFENELADFPIKNFLNEIIWRFALTPFKDKYSNHYVFKNISELVADNQVVNWSDKFQGVDSEKYIYSNYGQNNLLKYKYNDEQNTHNNGSIKIENVNIDAEKAIIESAIYSPEKIKTTYVGIDDINVYKLWEKEPKENTNTINYKALDKRYYFLRSVNHTFSNQKIGSEQLGNTTRIISTAPVESFVGLSFEKIVEKNYRTYQNILKKSKIMVARFFLNPIDIATFDFKKLYYIEQLGGQFLINKINNYVKNKITKVEMIKVEYMPLEVVPDNRRIILDSATILTSNNLLITIHYHTENLLSNNYVVQLSTTASGDDFFDNHFMAESPIVIQTPMHGIYRIRIKDRNSNIVSNILTVTI